MTQGEIMIRRVLLAAALCLASWPVWAYTVSVYTYDSVAGVDYARVHSNINVKLCRVGGASCSYGISAFGKATVSVTQEGYYHAYIYDGSGKWGSTDTPDPNLYYVYPILTEQVIRLSAFPRPLQPGLVSPCSGCLVPPGNFYLSWTNGLDWERTAPNWPVTYEIWTSSQPVGSPQGPEWLAVPDAPCNPDANGRCRWYVDFLVTEPGAKYTWRIVVKINFGGGIVYKTSGPNWTLYQRY
jgi:hypothetical protein